MQEIFNFFIAKLSENYSHLFYYWKFTEKENIVLFLTKMSITN